MPEQQKGNYNKGQENATVVKRFTDSQFVREFKDFINRGSVVELAIGVAVGGAFTTIVKSLVDDIIMPVTSLLMGGVDFTTLAIDIPNVFGANTTAHIAYGNFLQNVVNFMIVAFTVFVIVKMMNRMNLDSRAANTAEAERATEAAMQRTMRKTARKGAAEYADRIRQR